MIQISQICFFLCGRNSMYILAITVGTYLYIHLLIQLMAYLLRHKRIVEHLPDDQIQVLAAALGCPVQFIEVWP